jgi:hypothetical protein
VAGAGEVSASPLSDFGSLLIEKTPIADISRATHGMIDDRAKERRRASHPPFSQTIASCHTGA